MYKKELELNLYLQKPQDELKKKEVALYNDGKVWVYLLSNGGSYRFNENFVNADNVPYVKLFNQIAISARVNYPECPRVELTKNEDYPDLAEPVLSLILKKHAAFYFDKNDIQNIIKELINNIEKMGVKDYYWNNRKIDELTYIDEWVSAQIDISEFTKDVLLVLIRDLCARNDYTIQFFRNDTLQQLSQLVPTSTYKPQLFSEVRKITSVQMVDDLILDKQGELRCNSIISTAI